MILLASSTTVDLARAQFATTSLYHFLFVPLTLGLGPIVAVFQTMWHRTKDNRWLRLTHFFGTLFLINFAIGVATGLVQEFQFGMNWSVYSKFVGNVFGAPLAIESLAAFFLEATFLGVWIFGWNRLSPRLHLVTLWIAVAGTWVSAYFILVANSFMQDPVGYKLLNGQAVLTNVWTLLGSHWAYYAFIHTILAGLTCGAAVVFGVCQASGFVGGPIFPTLFIGGTAGAAVHELFTSVPLGLAFACLFAAVPGAMVSAPFAMVLVAAFMTQVGALQTAPVLIAVVTASLAMEAVKYLVAGRKRAAAETEAAADAVPAT